MTEKKNRMKPLYMPLYVEKFFADTIHLNPTEGWAYINLVCSMWRSEDGTLPNEADKLARAGRIHRPHWSRIWSAIKEQFDIDGDRVTNTHLQAELGKANARIVVARAKASIGGAGHPGETSVEWQSTPRVDRT